MFKQHNYTAKTVLCAGLLLAVASSNASLLKIKNSSVFAPECLGTIELSRETDGFHVLQNNKKHKVENYWLDKPLRKMDDKQLKTFLTQGYISVNKLDNGEFTLRSNVRGLGGGPLTGMVAAWCVRAIMYTPAVVAGAGAIVTTGPVGMTAATATAPGYIATVEGASAAAAILGYACVWLP